MGSVVGRGQGENFRIGYEEVPEWVDPPKPKLGSAPCPVCGKFAKVIDAGWIDTPDLHEWRVTTWCKEDGTQSTW